MTVKQTRESKEIIASLFSFHFIVDGIRVLIISLNQAYSLIHLFYNLRCESISFYNVIWTILQ